MVSSEKSPSEIPKNCGELLPVRLLKDSIIRPFDNQARLQLWGISYSFKTMSSLVGPQIHLILVLNQLLGLNLQNRSRNISSLI